MNTKSIIIGFEPGFSPSNFGNTIMLANSFHINLKQAVPIKERISILKQFIREDSSYGIHPIQGSSALKSDVFKHLQFSKRELWDLAYGAMPVAEKAIYDAYTLNLSIKTPMAQIISDLNALDGIAYVEENEAYQICDAHEGNTMVSEYYPYKMINWTYDSNQVIQGEGQQIIVMDTGINYKHGALQQVLWNDEYKENTYGYNFVDRNTDVYDHPEQGNGGHGTHVAGIIGTQPETTYRNVEISGIAPKASIISYKIFPKLTKSIAFDGLTTAAYTKASVINNSWNAQVKGKDQAKNGCISRALQLLYTKNIIPVFSAGNNRDNVAHYYPSGSKKVITVGAVCENYKKANISNYGDDVDIYAPGKRILSTETGLALNFDRFNYRSGTSMSAAFVTGAIALLKEKRKELNVYQIREILQRSGKKVFDENLGREICILDIKQALKLQTN